MKKIKPRTVIVLVLLVASVLSYGYLSFESGQSVQVQVERSFEERSLEHRKTVLPEAVITQRIIEFASSLIRLPR